MSLNDNLAKWLLKNESFLAEYKKLLKEVVSPQLGHRFESNEPGKTFDWDYLLYCASIFTSAKEGVGYNYALRIAQSALSYKKIGWSWSQ